MSCLSSGMAESPDPVQRFWKSRSRRSRHVSSLSGLPVDSNIHSLKAYTARSEWHTDVTHMLCTPKREVGLRSYGRRRRDEEVGQARGRDLGWVVDSTLESRGTTRTVWVIWSGVLGLPLLRPVRRLPFRRIKDRNQKGPDGLLGPNRCDNVRVSGRSIELIYFEWTIYFGTVLLNSPYKISTPIFYPCLNNEVLMILRFFVHKTCTCSGRFVLLTRES